MIILTQPPHSIWFHMWTTKCQQRKLGCIKKHVHIFICNSIILLHIILTFYPLPFNFPFFVLPSSTNPFYRMHWTGVFDIPMLNLHQHYQLHCAQKYACHTINNQSVSQLPLTGKETFFSVVLRPSTTSMKCSGSLTPLLIIILQACDNIENKHNYMANLQCSAHPYVLYQILHISEEIICQLFKYSMIFLLCMSLVSAPCFMSSQKKE